MEYLVAAEIEIDGNILSHYSGITLNQKFNHHHEFSIRLNHDVLESSGSFSLVNAQKNIGKSTLIRLQQSDDSNNTAYEFRGIICEVRLEQSGKGNSDIVLTGYSPTILLENGQHLASFYKKDLKKIVQQITKPLGNVSCDVKISPQYKKAITYICQYKESAFHFLNRLSAEFGEFCFYNGQALYFGKPSSAKTIDVVYGEDISSMQLAVKILPMTFSQYSYNSKSNAVFNAKAPSSVNGLGQYASYALKESDKVFSEPVLQPVKQRVESKSDLSEFVKRQKAAQAANLEVLTGTGFNPAVGIGTIMNVQVSMLQNNAFVKEDYGKFLVTGIEHSVTENGKYYNRFEAVPSGVEVLPVTNVVTPIAEPQVAVVTDNQDPDNLGRIKVQMLWQKESGETTDWVRVMTPDAGSSGPVSKNRGFVFIPEVGDEVLLCFRYNDADRPFVLGSIFHGKTANGGGSNNDKKTMSTKSGHTIEMNDTKGEEKIVVTTPGKHLIELNDKKGEESITVKDKDNNIITIDTPGGCITIQDKNKNSIVINSGDNSINIKAKDTITLAAMNINLMAGATANVVAGASYNLAAMNCLNSIGANTILRTGALTQMVKNTFSATANTINQTAKKDINTKAKEKITISSKDKLDQRAGSMDVSTDNGKLRFKSGSDVEIKGTTVKTN